jgi:hypothetical protein
MRITDIDPIRFGLLFERFLNPERVSMPDIDVDFCQDRRERGIAHVREKYGADYVSARSSPTASSRRRRRCATWPGCSDLNFKEPTASPSWSPTSSASRSDAIEEERRPLRGCARGTPGAPRPAARPASRA